METLKLALQASGCDRVEVVHKSRLLSDNGSSYIAGDLEYEIPLVGGWTLWTLDRRLAAVARDLGVGGEG